MAESGWRNGAQGLSGSQPGSWNDTALDAPARTAMATQFLGQVYSWMAGGLALSGATAMAVLSSEPLLQATWEHRTFLIVMELLTVIGFSALLPKMSASMAAAAFLFYASLTGVTFAPLLLAYTSSSVANVFFVTAGTFTGMAVYGTVTKRDLTSMGSFMTMGLIAILIAAVVNLFLASSALQFAVSLLGAVIFIGLTAYDVQRFKQMGYMGFADATQQRKAALSGALNLYLDFINLFLSLLRLFGSRR